MVGHLKSLHNTLLGPTPRTTNDESIAVSHHLPAMPSMETTGKWFTQIIRWIQNSGCLLHGCRLFNSPILQTEPSTVQVSSPHSGTLIVICDLECSLVVNMNLRGTFLRESKLLQCKPETSGCFPRIMGSNELSLSGATGSSSLSLELMADSPSCMGECKPRDGSSFPEITTMTGIHKSHQSRLVDVNVKLSNSFG